MPNESDLSRRGFIAGTIGTTLALSTMSSAMGSPAPMDAPKMNKADIDKMATELSNWNRWGPDDQMGTVNLITAAKRKQAISLAREGTVVSLSHAQSTEKSLDNTQPLVHTMGANVGQPDATGSTDTYTMTYHGTYYTHFDALCHIFYNGHTYNGHPGTIVTADGASMLDVAAFKGGIVTRGVLLDFPRVKNVPYLEPGTPLFPEDMDAAEKLANVKVTSGDALFIRTGRWARRAEKGSWGTGRNTAGLHATSLRWLKQHDISILTSDSISDVMPSQVDGVSDPIHRLAISAMGTPLIDNGDLEELSNTANKLHRYEFMFVVAPMVIPGGTGSPVNPLAIF